MAADERRQKERIVLSADDLDVEPVVHQPPPRIMQNNAPYVQKPASVSTGFRSNALRDHLLSGLVAGLAAWFFGDLFQGFDDSKKSSFIFNLFVDTGMWTAILGGIIGGVFGSLEGLTSGSSRKASQGGLIGLAVGAVGGFIGGVIAQFVYSSMLVAGGGRDMATRVVARTVGWTLAGLSIGLAQAVPSRQSKKIVNGLLGGLAGGALGGLCFDLIAGLASSGMIARIFGITAMGAAIGIAISMVESIRKEAWLEVAEGPLAGKQFIIYGAVTRIGRDHTCDITIGKDWSLLPEHCRIHQNGSRFELEVMPQAQVLVNGYGVTRTALYRGDSIRLGETTLTFQEKAVDRP